MRRRSGRRAQEALKVGQSYLGVVLGEAAMLTVVSTSREGVIARHRGRGLVLVDDQAPMVPACLDTRGRVRVERILPVLAHEEE